jgi:hypothetical protein
MNQEANYVESWPNTTSAWAGWSRFDIPVDRYGGVHSLLICTSRTLGSTTCHQTIQQDKTYSAKYQKADRASTLFTLWIWICRVEPYRSLRLQFSVLLACQEAFFTPSFQLRLSLLCCNQPPLTAFTWKELENTGAIGRQRWTYKRLWNN